MNKVYDFSFDQIVTSSSTDRSSPPTGQSSTDRSSPALTGRTNRSILAPTGHANRSILAQTGHANRSVQYRQVKSRLQWPCLTTTEGLQTTQRTPPLCLTVHVDSFPGDRCTGKVKTFYQKIRTLRKQTRAGSVKQEIKLVWP